MTIIKGVVPSVVLGHNLSASLWIKSWQVGFFSALPHIYLSCFTLGYLVWRFLVRLLGYVYMDKHLKQALPSMYSPVPNWKRIDIPQVGGIHGRLYSNCYCIYICSPLSCTSRLRGILLILQGCFIVTVRWIHTGYLAHISLNWFLHVQAMQV